MFDFLHRLNSDLDEVQGRLLGIKPFPFIREAFVEVRREESRKKVLVSSFSTIENSTQNSIVAASKLKSTPLHGESQ